LGFAGFVFGNFGPQRADLFLQGPLFGHFGVYHLLLGLKAGIFYRLQFGGLLRGHLCKAVFLLLNTPRSGGSDLTHPRVPRQIVQLAEHGLGL
jgi:hypothetical protein